MSKRIRASAIIIVFTKVPVPGDVKTRLIAGLGPERALTVAQFILRATVAGALATGVQVRCSFQGPLEIMQDLVNDIRVELAPQLCKVTDRQVPIRMVVDAAFDEGYRHVLVLPSDAPTVEPDLQMQALNLDEWDVAISPSTDGGFACLGLARRLPRHFDALNLTSETLYEQVTGLLIREGFSVHSLPSRVDIDDIDSLKLALDTGQLDHNPKLREALIGLSGHRT